MNELASSRKSQIQIESKNLEADKTVVEKIFVAVTNKFNLYDNTYESRVADTIKSIVEAKGFGFGLGARVVKNFIFVDFIRHKSNSPKFDEAHDFILEELQNSFHIKLQEIWGDNPAYCKSCWGKS